MGELVVTRKHVTYEAAAEAMRAGLAKAQELDVNAAIVVTDGAGEIVTCAKTEGVNPRGWRGGLAKATVAAGMGISTEAFLEKRLKHDEVLWRALSANPDTMFVPGGVPLKHDGVSVGGVGVSGGRYEDDAKVAEAVASRFAEMVEER